jgi:hypothetical protein
MLYGTAGAFTASSYLIASIVGPSFMIFIMLVLHFNDLIFLKTRAMRNASNIDVALKKRHTLVPELEQVVKTYMSHEAELLKVISDDRARAALDRFIALREDYPELKADAAASRLTRQLIRLENELAFTRAGYNDAAEIYNTRIQSFPDIVFAKLFRFKSMDFIHSETAVIRMPPSIRLRHEEPVDENED